MKTPLPRFAVAAWVLLAAAACDAATEDDKPIPPDRPADVMTAEEAAAATDTTAEPASEPENAGAPEAAAKPEAEPQTEPGRLHVDVRYETLDNGLKVVMAKDSTVPTVTVSFFTDVGFRTEPRDRSGFSHLFEHILFEETENLENGEFDRIIEGSGGVDNGYTTLDQTGFWEVVPSHLLETMLWIEADRLARSTITEELVRNQSDIVQNELRVRAINQPYGGFSWLTDWVQDIAFDNPFNKRDIDDEMADVDAATEDWAKAFYETYYRPNNVVLVIVGDLDYDQTSAWVHKYFDSLEAGPAVVHPDVSEAPQTEERHGSHVDPLAPRPAYVAAYRMPARNTPEIMALAVLDQILVQGDDSRLYQSLVVDHGYSSFVAGLTGWGDIYDQTGPTLWTVGLIHDADVDPDAITAAIDAAIQPILDAPLAQEEIDRARTKLRSSLYDVVDSATRSGLAGMLGVFALYDDDPGRINRLEDEFAVVTPELVHEVAQTYLRPTNRTVLVVTPPAEEPEADDETTGDDEAAPEGDQ